MTAQQDQKIYLKDYTPPEYLVDHVELTFHLDPHKTRVISKVQFRPNPDRASDRFFLHGEELTLKWAKIDGTAVTPEVTPQGLTCAVPSAPFVWEAEVEIDPANNTALEGLYMSNGMYCTQCEAQGFRKITYYPDRPDVMATFSVKIYSDLPVLLSNGDKIEVTQGFAQWHDPWPKPAYLFALVAGELINHPDRFVTKSGRDVELNIWVRSGDEDKCAFAMEALKASMKWDEDVYGREYDLDIFNIVAVDDFNMGAMENKGLNIFNSSAVLASPETSTDDAFERIEAIIAHEYFHNWTGNRITCRDWFQLSLKEGLTVYRDAQFTSDMRSAAVKRIEDVIGLRAHQIPQDNGPLAHPVRPESFVEINNFYTTTIYEKGAEVIGMLRTLVGAEAYGRALDLYFERHDGQACTIEDWLQVFEDTTGRDLSQFKLWYSQAGTPRIKVEEDFKDGTLRLTLQQSTPATPDQPTKKPMHIPVAVGLLAPDGSEMVPTTVLELREDTQTFEFENLTDRPVVSALRGFSAPVILQLPYDADRLGHLARFDTDPFNAWDAGNTLAIENLVAMYTDDAEPDADLIAAKGAVLKDESKSPAFRALALGIPSLDTILRRLSDDGILPDPNRIETVIKRLSTAIATAHFDAFNEVYTAHQISAPYAPSAEQSGKRALSNKALSYISLLDDGVTAYAQFNGATNMTQQRAALAALVRNSHPTANDALQRYFDQWSHERLVVDSWFSLQAALSPADRAPELVETLAQHPEFNLKNPNRFRSLYGAFSMNTAAFHRVDGQGYRVLCDAILALDPLVPQTAARMSGHFESWTKFDEARKTHAQAQFERILATTTLSRDTREMIERIAAG